MKKKLPLFIWIATFAALALSCGQENVEPSASESDSIKKGQASAQNAQPPAPATSSKNCQVTIYNASPNPFAHMSIALGSADMSGLMSAPGCPISPGKSATICLPKGDLTLFTFSNMYQFSSAITVTIGSEPITLRLKSGH